MKDKYHDFKYFKYVNGNNESLGFMRLLNFRAPYGEPVPWRYVDH